MCRRSRGCRTSFPTTSRSASIICFGTFGGWPAFAPDDLGRPVELINARQCRHRPPHRLDSHPDARSHRRCILRAARRARCQRRARLSGRDPHHGDVESARRGGAQISSGLRPRRLLRLRPHAARRDAAHPAGSPGRGENRWAGLTVIIRDCGSSSFNHRKDAFNWMPRHRAGMTEGAARGEITSPASCR